MRKLSELDQIQNISTYIINLIITKTQKCVVQVNNHVYKLNWSLCAVHIENLIKF